MSVKKINSALISVYHKDNLEPIIKLLHENGNILSREEIQRKFNLRINFLEYLSITHSIPQTWKTMLKSENIRNLEFPDAPMLLITDKMIKLNDVKTTDIYWSLINSKRTEPAAITKWTHIYPIDEQSWTDIFKNPYLACQETKIQSFQFKILHRIFPCNYWVSKWDTKV